MCFRAQLSIFIHISKSRYFVTITKWTHVDKVLLIRNEVTNLILKL
jgi:hypothetical protein